MTDEIAESRSRWITSGRLAIGLVQGLVLYLLYSAADDGTWPATNGLLFAPLVFLALYIPPLKLVSLGNIRIPTMLVWLTVAAVAVAGFAWYDIWHASSYDVWANRGGHWGYGPKIIPSFGAFFFIAIAAFVAQALVASGDADRKIVADYTTYFDVAWK